MLVRDLGRKFGAGIDLVNYEVKSAKRGGSYEYQYHKNTGRDKLARHRSGHLFFDYFENLRQVDLRYLHGSNLVQFFAKWLKEYPDPYLTLKDGEVVFPILASEAPPASVDAKAGATGLPEE